MAFWTGTDWAGAAAPSPRPERRRSPLAIVLHAGVISALILSVAAGSTLAAKGGGGGGGKGGGKNSGGSGTIALRMINDVNHDGLPNWGDTVTFDVATTATTQPNVDLVCTQNGTVVYGATTGYYDGYPWPWTQNMTLSSSKWTGGAASCTARLYAFAGSGTTTLATLSFTAGA